MSLEFHAPIAFRRIPRAATAAAAFGLIGAAVVGPVGAQTKTIYLASFGGSFEQTMRRDVLPAFETKYGVKVEYVAGNSTDTLAKLHAQRGNQQIDVIVVDDGPAYQAVELGFCSPLAASPVLDDLYPSARFASGSAVGIGLVATGIMYSKKAFEDAGWAPPSSWADLDDPKYRKRLVIPPLNNTYGLHALVAQAERHGGGAGNIEPGFKAFRTTVGPNVLAYEPSPAKMAELFQNGQAVIAVWGSGRAKQLADTGFPAEFVYPKEGAIALAEVACVVSGSRNTREGQELIQYLLSPPAQTALARGAGVGPVNKTVTLNDNEQKGIPYGAAAEGLRVIAWQVVNARRDEWNRRWVREIER